MKIKCKCGLHVEDYLPNCLHCGSTSHLRNSKMTEELRKFYRLFGHADDRLSRAISALMRVSEDAKAAWRDLVRYCAPRECGDQIRRSIEREARGAVKDYGYTPVEFLVEYQRRATAKEVYFTGLCNLFSDEEQWRAHGILKEKSQNG